MEFLQANWFWILLGGGALWFLFRRGGMGCGMGNAARMNLTHRAMSGGRHPLRTLTMVTAARSLRCERRRPRPLVRTGAVDQANF